ncbi:hypothetical protein MOQ_007542 [Trypanosoma cruzi marinkellei]|uniref:Uncharacterized protein n=1 Tax=Trypanosoma cruzi marinkellei TaxID=85056 RepID=K2NIG3_TRYCR|nr:hypothetical protein MOQ_007542 [Trypanosoma cruzi marinkellei]
MQGLLRLLDGQAEPVGHVSSYCGRTSALCRSLGRRTSIRRSLVGEDLRFPCREAVPAEAAAGRFFSVGKGRHHRYSGLLVVCRAHAILPKSGRESRRVIAYCRDSGHDAVEDTRNRVLATPTSARHAVRVLVSSWKPLQYGRLTAVRKPTCQALAQSCGRDRALTASASAVTLRAILRCNGEDTKPTVQPRSASESGMMQISSVASSCAASGPRRSALNAEKKSVARGIRVGDRDAAARRGPGNVRGHAQWQKTPLVRSTQSC